MSGPRGGGGLTRGSRWEGGSYKWVWGMGWFLEWSQGHERSLMSGLKGVGGLS